MSLRSEARRQKIIENLSSEGFCSVGGLANLLSVSEVTIRNDLSALEREGLITRTHGGAVLCSSPPQANSFQDRAQRNLQQKRQIARYAAQLIEDSDSIILDASTTAYQIAEFVSERENLTVFTNGIDVAMRLAENPSNKVILIGGLLRLGSRSLAAQFATQMLANVRVNKAFLSCTGVSEHFDCMDNDLFEVQIKSALSSAAVRVFVVADATKLGKQGLASFVPISRVSRLITDDTVDEATLARLRQTGVPISICGANNVRTIDATPPRQQPRIGFANQDDAGPFAALVRQGLIEAAGVHGVDLRVADNRSDGPTALANVERFLREGVDLVIEYNIDVRYGNMIMQQLRSAGVPAIAVDIPLPGATFFGVDNYRAGLLAGRLLGQYIRQHWQGQVDAVLSLGLPISGPVPAARMQGQIDGLRELVTVPDEAIIHLDSKNTHNEAHGCVRAVLPGLAGARRIAIAGINDETVLGALQACHEAGRFPEVIAASMGADQEALRELRRPGTRLLGGITFFPERYGDMLINIALQILQGQQVPPAVCTDHIYVLSEATMQTLDLEALPGEVVSAAEYDGTQMHLQTRNILQPLRSSPLAPIEAVPGRLRWAGGKVTG